MSETFIFCRGVDNLHTYSKFLRIGNIYFFNGNDKLHTYVNWSNCETFKSTKDSFVKTTSM